MALGLSLATFTALHVAISLVAIVTGFVVAYGMVKANPVPIWTEVFLATTILTSVTGFLFPFEKILPSHIFGIISLPVLALSLIGLFAYHRAGPWRWIYVVTSIFALYLNTFVLVVQSFLKVRFLQPLAPTQSEPPFVVAQLLVLVLCVALGFLAVRRFRPGSGGAALEAV